MKVAIVGRAPSSRMLAPYQDNEWEIWSLSDNYTFTPRWTRWFELHPLQRFREKAPQYIQWMQQQTQSIYLQHEEPSIPASLAYPKEAALNRFGSYMTNSISWMIALAILEGASHVSLFGVDMAQDSEYQSQRPSCEYLIGCARGAGITVWIPDQSDLLKCRAIYGYDGEQGAFGKKLIVRRTEYETRGAEYQAEHDEAIRQHYMTLGAIQELAQLQVDEAAKPPLEARQATLRKQSAAYLAKAREAERKVWMLEGGRQDIDWVRQWA